MRSERLNRNSSNYVGRVTGLPWVMPDNRNHLQLGLSYGDADVDRNRVFGNTKMLLIRAQWLF